VTDRRTDGQNNWYINIARQYARPAFYQQACAKRSHADIVLTQWSKKYIFCSAGATRFPLNVKFGMGERTEGPLARTKFHVYLDRNEGIQRKLPKLSKFRILAINLPLKGHSFA